MSTVTILCKTPGFRRLGKAHAAAETYEAGHWTPDDIAIFESDPNFSVIVDRGEAAPIPGVAPSYGLAGETAFLQGLRGVFDTFLGQLDVRLEGLFGRFDAYRADALSAETFAEAGPSARIDPSPVHSEGVFQAGAVVQPGAIAPGADVSDAIQDNGTGPAINDLGAKSDGVGPSAAIGTAEGLRPPVFDDARIQAIRSTLKTFDPATDFAGAPGRPHRKKLREQLGFEPSAAEIAEARIEAVAPEATVTT